MRLSAVLGVCEIKPYDKDSGKLGGWFPVDNVNFGFTPKGHESQTQKATPGGAAAPPPAAAAGAASPGAAEESDFTEMSVAKAVDMATVNLMTLAMQSRDQAAGKESAITADIHFIGSVHIEGEMTNIFTFLRIHLEGVEIKEWGVSASGDERPNEEIKLVYEKAAMCYETTDGKVRLPRLQAGWDQTKNEKWSYEFPKST